MSMFRHRARELRESFGKTQQQIGDIFGYRKNAPSQWERGDREPAFDDLMQLAAYYGVTTDWFLGMPEADRDAAPVRKAKAALADYLRLREGNLIGVTPAQRVELVYRFLAETAPGWFDLERVAAQLLITPQAFTNILNDRALATPAIVHQFSAVTGVPEPWFYVPNPQIYRQQDPQTWRPLIDAALAAGMTPQEAAHLLTQATRARAPR